MLTDSDMESLKAPQHEVQRLLGLCLLRIQQYEHLLKAIVAHHDLYGTPSTWEAEKAKRVQKVSTKTLGGLVGDLMGSYLVDTGQAERPPDHLPDGPEPTVRMTLQLQLEAADWARTQKDLKDLVKLRNGLVHHFIDRHDLGTIHGCLAAQEVLVADYKRIDLSAQQLAGWAEQMEQTRISAAAMLQSDAVRDLLLEGSAPDGSNSLAIHRDR